MARDRRVATFLVLVFSTTWLFQLPAMLAPTGHIPGPPERYGGLVVLGFFAPFIIAVALAFGDRKTGALGALFRPLAPARWRVGAGWSALALLHSVVILAFGLAVVSIVGGLDVGPWVRLPSKGVHIAAMLLIPFTEQVPWRAFAYARVRERRSALPASLIVGAAWALFHVQKHLFLDANFRFDVMAATVVLMVAGTVVYSWFYERTRGSLVVVALAQVSAYLNNSANALPENVTPLIVHALVYAALAIGLVVFDRRVDWLGSIGQNPDGEGSIRDEAVIEAT